MIFLKFNQRHLFFYWYRYSYIYQDKIINKRTIYPDLDSFGSKLKLNVFGSNQKNFSEFIQKFLSIYIGIFSQFFNFGQNNHKNDSIFSEVNIFLRQIR